MIIFGECSTAQETFKKEEIAATAGEKPVLYECNMHVSEM